MARGTSLTTIGEAEYEAIEAAVMETARGRWFLAEFARRNRTADTQVLLDAIGRLEQAVVAERSAQGPRPPPLRSHGDGEGDRHDEGGDRRDPSARPPA